MVAMMDFQATRWTMAGEVPKQAGNDHPTTTPTGLFRTSDGVINIAGGGQNMWERIVKVLGVEAEAADPDMATDTLRSRNRAKVNAMIERVTQADTAAHWVARFNREGVPCGPVYAMDEVFADEQVKHLGLEMTVQHPRLGALGVVRAPMQIAGVAWRKAPTPERGQHTDEVLAEFGFSAEEIAALRTAKAV
jgi:crotonobetainyl-CoA:carnitine CoA-transferase CaiB-like acyl-CoA transferase